MKTPPNQTAFESVPDKRKSTSNKFSGTDNPLYLRTIHALMTRPQRREHIDATAGCSNGPDLIARIRRLGLDIPCELISDLDRDGRPIKRGVYHLVKSDRYKVNAWLRKRDAKGCI